MKVWPEGQNSWLEDYLSLSSKEAFEGRDLVAEGRSATNNEEVSMEDGKEGYCRMCKDMLILSDLPAPEVFPDGKYHVALVLFRWEDGECHVHRAITLLKMKLPGIKFHRATWSWDCDGWKIQASHERFEPREGDAFSIPASPEIRLNRHEVDWLEEADCRTLAVLSGEEIREMFLKETGEEVIDAFGDQPQGDRGEHGRTPGPEELRASAHRSARGLREGDGDRTEAPTLIPCTCSNKNPHVTGGIHCRKWAE